MSLNKSISYINGFGLNRTKVLEKELKIYTLNDLLYFFPRRYVDRSKFYTPSEIDSTSAELQIIGIIKDLKIISGNKGKRLIAKLCDEKSCVELVWFKGIKWVESKININQKYLAFGRVNKFGNNLSIPHPEIEIYNYEKLKHKKGNFQPIYPSTEKVIKSGLTQKKIRESVYNLLKDYNKEINEVFSCDILKKYKLVDKKKALFNIHFPKNQKDLNNAEYRLKFEELFFLQLQLVLKKNKRKIDLKSFSFPKVGKNFNEFYEKYLPFNLTNAQKKVVREIRKDLKSNAQMNRLLQGDVGSGKTIVAFLTILICIDNDMQSAMVAPTEILAQQHYNKIKSMCDPLKIEIGILTGSTKRSDRTNILNKIDNGSLKILIGTHALFEEKVKFKNLGLAIIDEQHRFGVAQRSKLWLKNTVPPNVLVMTATPIPRTLAMTVYGDLDISVIDELPPGRKPINTVHKYESKRLSVFKFLKEEISKGRQIYIVYPLISESKKLDYKDLMDGYESICREFPNEKYQISIMHGRMNSENKALEMERFKNGITQIMVSTTVIEVGVNIPNASVMVIESAERFGLSQLHQLRGRVGRGTYKSYCILMTKLKLSEEAKTRITSMVRTQDGFELSEIDLHMRGPGDIMGTQQSGLSTFLIADIKNDNEIFKISRHAVNELIKYDKKIENKSNINISNALKKIEKGNNIWKYIG